MPTQHLLLTIFEKKCIYRIFARKYLQISKKYCTFATDLVFAIRERRTLRIKLVILKSYERARFSHIVKKADR